MLLKLGRLELAADLHQDTLAGIPRKRGPQRGETDFLDGSGFGVHLHLLPLRVVPGVKAHLFQVEVTFHESVDAAEDVENKIAGNPLRIVIGPFQDRRILDAVDAQQEKVGWSHGVGEVLKEADELGAGEVADGTSEKDEKRG